MFTIAFRDGSDGDLVFGARPDFKDEVLRDPYKNIEIKAQIGESFMDFISLSGDISNSGHPYIALTREDTGELSEKCWFFVRVRQFLDLGIDNAAFFSMPCLMYFLELTGLQIPAMYHELVRKEGHEEDCLEDIIPEQDGADHFEHSMRAYLAAEDRIYDVPLTVYQCDSIEDVCIASLHFLITHKFNIRKCKNCGKYFVAYHRSDTEYCDRISPHNVKKTCKEDGPRRTYDASVNADQVKKRLQQIETARRMRIHRNPDNWDMEREFNEWRRAMKNKRDAYRSGRINAEQFLSWLEKTKTYTEDWDYEENEF